jgi:hypothetical protein
MSFKAALRIIGAAWIACGLAWIGSIGSQSPIVALVMFGTVALYEFLLIRSLVEWEKGRQTTVKTSTKAALIAVNVVLAAALTPPALRYLGDFYLGPTTDADCIAKAKDASSDFIAKKLYRECTNELYASQERKSLDKSQCVADGAAFKNTPPANDKMAKVRATDPALQGMDDQRAVRYLHNVYYSDLPIERVAEQLGVALAPTYRESCMRHFPEAYK